MEESGETRIFCDYLIIGSGIAGLFAALKAAEDGEVTLITKRKPEECNTSYAQGGIACVTAQEDSFEEHINDTLETGAGLCHTDVVRSVVHSAPDRIRDLINYGVGFTKRGEVGEDPEEKHSGDFDLGQEGGHSRRRVLHSGDITGKQIVDALVARCREHPRITILTDHMAVDLISSRHVRWQEENCCLGAYVMDRRTRMIKTFISKYTLLATGGAGKVYFYTSNADTASGDGVAMAYRAYADIANMEFYQFHPTCLFHPQAKSFLISEAVRGEGAQLKVRNNGDYDRFMERYHPYGELAPRDAVARAIDNELKCRGEDCAFLDITHRSKSFLKKRFPNIYDTCYRLGVDMSQDLIPVVPAAHYCCGGVKTDVNGCTTVKNLYAIGEVACSGLHGANRLASNSLLEAAVLACNAVEHIRNSRMSVALDHEEIPDWSSGDAVNSDEEIVISHNWDEIRLFMWDYVGIVRTNKRLERAKNRIRLIRNEIEKYYWDFLLTPDLVELRDIASVAEMIIDSATSREESRGLHYNLDYPANSAGGGKDTLLRRPTKAILWKE